MSNFHGSGKIADNYFHQSIYPFCGAARPEVKAGAAFGVDVSIINLPNGFDMALTSDPLSLIPSIGLQESAWLSVHLMANDMATTGVAPMYAQFVLNLPESTTPEQFEEYWRHIHNYCSEIKVSITGGHTGVAAGQHSTLAGGGTMVSIAPADTFLLSKYAQPGDVIIVTAEAAMLSTAILAMSFPKFVKDKCGVENYNRACDLFYNTSSLKAGLVAAGNDTNRQVTAMHDVTEGGILGAIYEMVKAAGTGASIEASRLPVGPAQQAVCRLFGIDPMFSIGAGSMIITARAGQYQPVIHRLQLAGINAAVVGVITEREAGINIHQHGSTHPLVHPGTDPYWLAYFNALNNGWN
ncbi:AIR synthase-related protein [Paraflavitalea sp. CAU 1676]|uniref:AIR synthase-related protein n=1 Tax=Paraflavitalea sp. CAU 1676 TaxID=3032598 RepID=UPI0023DA4E90|nr:AIR synthase-related protein [Paraflavitalea sp. CAU 1676]MDF2190936.1 AIR synthase-related protein [Paraflavitalea sp. CAU 1676]